MTDTIVIVQPGTDFVQGGETISVITAGAQGPAGESASGEAGGTTHQLLRKATNADYDVEWYSPSSLGQSFLDVDSTAAARALINAARTDGVNTFSGTQTVSSGNLVVGSGFLVNGGDGLAQSNYFTDYNNNVAYLNMATDSTHAVSLVNRTSTKTALTLNLASGQTAAAISILDSLGSSLAEFTSTGRLNLGGVTIDPSGTAYYNGNFRFQMTATVTAFTNISSSASTTTTVASTLIGLQAQTAPLQAYNLVSSTSNTQVAADTYSWTNSTHATRTPRIVRSITDYGAEREYMRVDADGTQNRVSLFSAVSTGLTIESVAIGTDDRTRLRHSGGSAGFVFRATGTIASDGVLQAPYLAAGSLAWYGSEAYGAGSYNHLRIVPSSVSGASAAIDLIALRYTDSGYPTVRFSANGYTFNSGNSTGWPSGNGVQYGTPTLTETGTGNWTFTARTSGTVPLSVVLASGQTANGIEQRTSLGAVNFSVSAGGTVQTVQYFNIQDPSSASYLISGYDNSGSASGFGSAGYFLSSYGAGSRTGNMMVGTFGSGAIQFYTATTKRFEISSSGGIGFFGATPVAKPTGVPVTAADIHAALVSLGLIAA